MYNAIAANKRNTVLIMIGFVLLIGGAGALVSYVYGGGPATAISIVVGTLIYAWMQYYFASKFAMAATGAREIEKKDNPRLWRIVENLAITNGMPMPKVCIMNDPAPNAFATGRDPDHALVAATTGLLDIMNDRELEAVFAHEMAHVKNYDIRVSMIAFGLASALAVIADIAAHMMIYSDNRDVPPPIRIAVMIALAVLLPLAATIIQMAISRQREYLADATCVKTTRDPEGLASALEKLMHHTQPMSRQSTATAHLFFTNPLRAGVLTRLFSTHPPLEDRIARLRGKLTQL